MNCRKSPEMDEHFKQIGCNEELNETSVKKAMECLQISSKNPIITTATHHSSDSQFGGDSNADKQNNRQTKDNDLNTKLSAILFTKSSKTSLNSENTPKEMLNVINKEEEMEGYSSDSIYESSSENEYPDTAESCEQSCEQSCEVTQNQKNNVNSVIDSEPSMGTKYPLKYKWQLWFWKADQGIKVIWEEALKQVCKPFDTVEHFWRLYHHIIPVRQLVSPSDYCVFKEGISPMWEDSHNINGGKWTLDFPKGPNRTINPHLDEIWLEVLLCLIGEGFNEFSEDICGAVVNIRSKEDRISVWTANANKSVSNLKIGEILKIRSGYEGKIKYEAHTTSQRIALAKDRLFDPRLSITSKPKSKTIRRSCAF